MLLRRHQREQTVSTHPDVAGFDVAVDDFQVKENSQAGFYGPARDRYNSP